MTDIIWVAAITTLGTLLGAAVGSLSSIFGPVWHERQRREADAAKASDDLRYQRAELFLAGVSRYYAAEFMNDIANIEQLRLAFVATLRPGEGRVDEFTRDLVKMVKADKKKSIAITSVAGTSIFGWLRGDVAIAELDIAKTRASLDA